MKNLISFIIFIVYDTLIFFLPNNEIILICILINLVLIIFTKISIKHLFNSILSVLPFIIFTFVINCFMDNFMSAIWIGIKLIIVCNITIIYSSTTSVIRSSRNNKIIMYSIKNI